MLRKFALFSRGDDSLRFRLLGAFVSGLVLAVLLFNFFEDYLQTEIIGYLQRKAYYERVISNKGLPLHRGMYWKEKD